MLRRGHHLTHSELSSHDLCLPANSEGAKELATNCFEEVVDFVRNLLLLGFVAWGGAGPCHKCLKMSLFAGLLPFIGGQHSRQGCAFLESPTAMAIAGGPYTILKNRANGRTNL